MIRIPRPHPGARPADDATPRPHRLAAEALRLRAWAAPLLLADAPPSAPPRVSRAAWDFFALMEWCALALAQRLEAAGALGLLDDGARAALAAAADLEAARIRSARERIVELDAIAGRTGRRILVLKGAVANARLATLHLEDVDVLVDADAAESVVGELDPERRHGPWTLGQYRVAAATSRDVAVEVHTTVRELAGEDPLDGATSLPGHAHLLEPDPAAHLWHVWTHPVVSHSDRVARIRDLLLLRFTLAHCPDEALQQAVTRATRSDYAASLAGVLDAARTGTIAAVLERHVRQRYFLVARWRWLGRARPLQMLLTIAAELTAPPRSAIVRKVFEPPDRPSAFPGFTAIFRRAPGLDRALRLAWRPLLLLAAAGLSAGAALEARLVPAPREPVAPLERA
jgi:hypothetical protein